MPEQPVLETRPLVPFRDLEPVHRGLRAEILAEIAELIDSAAFTNGPQVESFERAFADYCGRRFCVGVGSGLDALRLGLLAAGLEPGNEVIVPANTFIATFEAVSQAGGIPVFVDVSEDDYNIDVEATEAAVTGRTRFLLPVHLYGQMADMRALERLAGRRSLTILEDACQAHGAERDGLRAGAVGTAGAFSFWPGKNLGAMGDAGALVTDDPELAASVRALREHGQRAKHEHDLVGYTSRLDTIQALVLLRKLPLLDGWNEQRSAAAAFYSASLEGVGDLCLPPVPPRSNPVWHLYPLRTSARDRLLDFLAERGIGTGRHAPNPAHLSAAYAPIGHSRGAFPVTEALADESLLLPLFPGISEEQLQAVVDAVTDFFRGG